MIKIQLPWFIFSVTHDDNDHWCRGGDHNMETKMSETRISKPIKVASTHAQPANCVSNGFKVFIKQLPHIVIWFDWCLMMIKNSFCPKILVYWSRSVFLIMWTGSDYDMDNNVASADIIMHRLLSHFSDKQHQSLVWEMMMLWYLRGTLLVIKFSTVSPEY